MSLFWVLIVGLIIIFIVNSGNKQKVQPRQDVSSVSAQHLADILLKKGIITKEDLLPGITGAPQSHVLPEMDIPQPVVPAHISPVSAHVSADGKKENDEKQSRGGSNVDQLETWFSGNWLTIVGVFAVLFGVGFFLKYSFDNELIGETGRIILGIVSGLIFLFLGEFFNKKYSKYAHLLSGGGIALLYLSTYGILYYHLLDPFPTLLFMGVVTAVSIMLAVRYQSKGIAALGLIGGFVTPVLFGSDLSNFTLANYLIVLNLGLLALAYFRDWREMLWGSFIGTSLLVSSWIGTVFVPSEIWLFEAYLAFFWLMFTIATLLHYYFHKRSPTDADLLLMVFIGITYAGSAYSLLVRAFGSGLHYASLLPFSLAVAYLLISVLGFYLRKEEKKLVFYPAGLAVLFTTLIFPIELHGSWLTVSWFCEAAILAGIGSVLRSKNLVFYALPVYGLAILTFLWSGKMFTAESTPIFNERFALYLVGIASAFLIMYFFYRLRSQPGTPIMADEGDGAGVCFIVANLFIGLLLVTEISTFGDFLYLHPRDYIPLLNTRFLLILLVILYAFAVSGMALWKGDRRGRPNVVSFFVFANILVVLSLLLEISDFYQYTVHYTAFFNARTLIMLLGGAYAAGVSRFFYAKLKALPGSADMGAVFFVACNLMMLALGVLEIHDYYRYVQPLASIQRESVFISLYLLSYGFIALIASLVKKFGLLRKISLGVLVVVVFKAFMVDIWVLSGLYRVMAFMSLGVVLLVVGYLYYRYKEQIISFIKAEESGARIQNNA